MTSTISPTSFFSLTNSYTGPSFALTVDTSSSDLELLVASTDHTGLSWQFQTAPDATKYNICTEYSGLNYCLDILGANKTIPHLAAPAHVSGQQWSLLPSNRGDGTYKLSNDYSGSAYYLDIYSDSKQAVMSKGDFSGQYWSLNDEDGGGEATTTSVIVESKPTTDGAMSTGTSKSALSITVTVPALTTPSVPTPTITIPSPTKTGGAGLRKSAKLGMGVSLGLGVPAIFLALILW